MFPGFRSAPSSRRENACDARVLPALASRRHPPADTMGHRHRPAELGATRLEGLPRPKVLVLARPQRLARKSAQPRRESDLLLRTRDILVAAGDPCARQTAGRDDI